MAHKTIDFSKRLNKREAVELLLHPDLAFLSQLADDRRRLLNGDLVFYNQNFHIEPSNVCVHRCKFCSFRRDTPQDEGAWTLTIEEMCNDAFEKYHPRITEVHITGGVHPHRNLFFYTRLIKALRKSLPNHVSIKAFSAIEIDDMCKMADVSVCEGLRILKKQGVDAIPGGGAEIFDPKLRAFICPDKADVQRWLSIHDEAHRLGISSNATMLFGHLETVEQQVNHLEHIRIQQDKSGGFSAFIPLKYKAKHNQLTHLGEADTLQTMRLFAVSRLFLDNIPHIKAYWPMLGKEATQLALLFGADDLDGTIQKSTKIYSMAGAEDQEPNMSIDELCLLVKAAGYRPVERDSFYRIIHD